MEESRYRDKSYLVTYELTTDIFDAFGIKVDDIVPIRSVYMLYTDRGIKVLKKVAYGLDELEFINSIIEHVCRNGYEYVAPFMKTISGSYYMERDDGCYVILTLVEGREADYRNPIDIAMVSKALCRFHKATTGIGNVIERRNNLYKWMPTFKRRAGDFIKFRDIAEMHEIKSDFDRVFLDNVNRYYDEASRSIELLEGSNYEKLCSEAMDKSNICHHDLAYHNIIIDNDNNVYFVDFDYSIMDLRIHDIANLLVKSIKHCNWDMEKARNILDSYCAEDELRREELEALYGFLMFPQDFYEISRFYYTKAKSWDEDDFLIKLKSRAGYYDDRKAFLEGFGSIVRAGI